MKKMLPEVSVIIPLYNKGSHIGRAIDSVLSQTVQDFEIIIVDGNSTDDGPEIVKKYSDPRIQFYIQQGSGVSSARNQGAGKAQSGFIAFLDADDEWMPNHLEVLDRLRRKFPDAGLYSTAYQTYLTSGKRVNSFCKTMPESEGLLPDYFECAASGDDPVWTSATGMDKELFFNAGGFQEGVSMGEDLDLWAKIAMKYSIAFSTEISAVYHTEASNRACESFHPTEELAFVKNIKRAIAEGRVSQKILPHVKKYIARKEIDTAIINIFAGDYRLARKVLARTDKHFFWLEQCIWRAVTGIPPPVFNRLKRIKHWIFLQFKG